MQPTLFIDAVHAILIKDSRFDIGAYFFLKDALDFTAKRITEETHKEHRHVSAQELCYGFRDFALQEFGPMAITLLNEWGIHSCKDIGAMVFMLIDEGAFGKQESDTPEDFLNLFSLSKSLQLPFLPSYSHPHANK